MSMAAIAEELSTEPITPASNMTSAINRVSLSPPALTTTLPRRWATPVFTNPALTTKMAAMRITTGEPKPASASLGASTRVDISATTTSSATISARGRPQANNPTATASIPKTINAWPVIAYLASEAYLGKALPLFARLGNASAMSGIRIERGAKAGSDEQPGHAGQRSAQQRALSHEGPSLSGFDAVLVGHRQAGQSSNAGPQSLRFDAADDQVLGRQAFGLDRNLRPEREVPVDSRRLNDISRPLGWGGPHLPHRRRRSGALARPLERSQHTG